MTRSPLFLAALASSAVPGLDPVAVEGVASGAGDRFDLAFVRDRQEREWVVTVPRTPAAGALLDDVVPLSALLARRLDLAVPAYRGHAPVPEGRAAVHPRMPGRPVDFAALPAGAFAAEVGRALAHVHNIEHLLYEEAGRPSYTAAEHRHRRLSELDRAASTGHVPTGLLNRWEGLLEDVSLWRFAPTAVHGRFTGAHVLATFDDEDDASTGHVVGLLAWEESRIADPADDFADLVAQAAPSALDAVLEAYAESRVERPDGHLVRRARLAAEMAFLSTLLEASASGDERAVKRTAALLRDLDERVDDVDREYAREDAARSERTRRAQALAAADELDPDDPEHPLASGDQHRFAEPFPMLAETQAVPMGPLLTDAGPDTDRRSPTDADLQREPEPEPDRETEADPGAARADETQRIMLLVDDAARDPGDVRDPATEPESDAAPDAARDPTSEAEAEATSTAASTAGAEPSSSPNGAREAAPRPGPVPYLDAGDASPFEIAQVEALPEGDSGLLDLHEGASEFVPVDRRRESPGA